MKYDKVIGIDPGVKTGYAVWNCKDKKFDFIGSDSILKTFEKLSVYAVFGNNLFVIENPNLRKWFGKTGRERLQGAGSIKRDFSIWMEWLAINKCKFQEIPPKSVKTKIDSKTFQKITGWSEPTNSHSRDASMMVFNF